MGGATWGTRVGTLLTTTPFFVAAFPVLLIPFFGHFMWPFAVAGLGFKNFVTSSLLRLGHPWREPLHSAFMSDDILGLHNNLCANFTAFAHVCTECMKVVSSPHVGVFAIGKVGCGAQAIQGPLVAGLILLLGLQNWILGRSAAVLAAGLRWGLWGGPINQCWGLCTLLK